MAWDYESRKRVDRANRNLTNKEWSVNHAERDLDEARYTAKRSLVSWFLAPIIFTILSAAGTVASAFNLPPVGAVNSEKDWALPCIILALTVLLFSGVAIFQARDDRKCAPNGLVEAERNLADRKLELVEATDEVARVTGIADRKAEEAKRFVKLQDNLLAVSTYLEGAAEKVSENTAAGSSADDAWVALAKERGWTPEVTTLMRGAEEALVLARA